MKKLLLAFFLYNSTLIICTAQQTNLDSLFSIWQDQTQSDSVRVGAFKIYVRNGFMFSNPDSAMALTEGLHSFAKTHSYPKAAALGYNLQGMLNVLKGNYPQALEDFEKSLKVNEEINYKNGISTSLNNIGVFYNSQSNYPSALVYYEKSLKILEELGNKKGIATSLNNIGNIYKNQSNHPLALEYYEKSLKIKEEIGDKKGIAVGLNNIGIINREQGNYLRALEYFEKALKTFELIGYKKGIASILNNIGGIYTSQGNSPRALEYYEKSLKINEEIGDIKGGAICLNNIGIINKEQGNYPRALEYYDKSLKIYEKIGDKNGIASGLGSIGNIYQLQGDYLRALDFCKRGLDLAEEIEVLERKKGACQCLYDTYKAMGNGNEALVYLERIQVIDDSLNAEETAKKIQQMEFAKIMLQDSIATAEKERLVKDAHQEEIRAKEKTRNIAFLVGGLVLLLAVGLYGSLRFVRKSRANLQVEKDRSENLLHNILPADIATELKEKGKAAARDFKMVSILFTDFIDFTEQSAKLSPADLVDEINHCFEAFDGIMEKYGIEKIKTIGDAYMAAGGLPIPTDDSVKNTVLAALEMQRFVEERKMTNDSKGKPAFEMRVGIHTGPVVAGIVGVKKFQYDIWGDTVNTASRMESSGEVGKVNISRATYELLKNDPDFAFESRGKIEAKGKGEMEMYFVSMKA